MLFAKSIFTSILKVSDKFIEKCRRSRDFGDGHLAKWHFEIRFIFVVFGVLNDQFGSNLHLIGFAL